MVIDQYTIQIYKIISLLSLGVGNNAIKQFFFFISVSAFLNVDTQKVTK